MNDPYEKTKNIFAHSSVPWQQKIIVDFISDIRPDHSDACLDVGTGIGNNIAALLRFYKEVHAADISQRALSVLNERYKDSESRIKTAKMDAASLIYPDNMFDLVVCTEVLEHCLMPDKVISECVRVLKPGGYLLLSSPNYFNPAGVFKKFYEKIHPHETWDAWGNHDEGRENFITTFKLKTWAKNANIQIGLTRGGDLVRSWLPFLSNHYKIIDRHPFLGIGRLWPVKLFMMNYFILGRKPSSHR